MRALDIVISIVGFAIFYTPLNWFLNRSQFSWRSTAISIVAFAAVYLLVQELGLGKFLAYQLNVIFHTFRG